MRQDLNLPWPWLFSRREFLNLWLGASAGLIPAAPRAAALEPGAGFGPLAPGFVDSPDACSLTPHYRVKSSLEDVLSNVVPGRDAFPNEKYAAEIESVLAAWGEALRQSPAGFRGIAKFLDSGFKGSSLQPLDESWIRREPSFEVSRCRFSSHASLSPDQFLQEWSAYLGNSVLAAEFKLPRMSVSASVPMAIQTRVRYDLVTSGAGYHRQEHVGYWDLEWVRSADGRLTVRQWQAVEETRSRTAGPVFEDVTARALGGNPSYREQMLQGCDYWRTVLDGASGIDIYGNNGVAVGDIDNDGFDDLYVCQPAGLPNRLYRNRGDGTFEDITEESGVGVLDGTACALFADVTNNGRQDLVVVRTTGPLLFLNEGGGKFRLKPDAFHFAETPQGTFTGASFGDYDRDGWLDIYFCLYSFYQGLDQSHDPTPYFDAQNGPPNFFLRNNRDGTFSDVTASTGLNQNNNHYSFDCGWCDYDGNGWPDLYVVNDFGRKNLYRNNGNGTFTDVAEEAGVLDIGPGMSSCWFDYDNDGKYDLYVSDMWEPAGMRVSMSESFMPNAPERIRALFRRHAKGNSLFHNLGNGRFEDQSATGGVEMTGWSWSCFAWDFDHDGFPDLYIANGMISGPGRPDLESFFWRQVVSRSPSTTDLSRDYEKGWNAVNELIRSDSTWNGYQRNVFYLNNRDGTFSHISGVAGLDFPDDSRAFALADLDHDGRLEMVLKNRTGPQLRILRNVMQDIGDSIAFRLRGRTSNPDAIGAEVTLETGQGRQVRFIQAGSGFVSQHTKEVFFGLGKGAKPVTATVRWPNGLVQRFENLPVNHRVEIEEGVAEFHAKPFEARMGRDEPLPAQEAPAAPAVSETWLIDPPAAPDFSLPGLDGEQHTLAGHRGHPVLLNLWTVGCSRCREQLAFFQKNYARWSAQGLEVLAVSASRPEQTDAVRALAKELGLAFPVLLASDDAAGIYNVLFRYMFDRRRNLSLPTTFLVDSEGSIVKVYQGPFSSDPPNHLPRTSAERVRLGLPFKGTYYGGEFRRNYFTYGVAFTQSGYFDEALAQIHLFVRQHPNFAQAYYNLGTIYLQKNMRAEARENLLKAVQLSPGYANALNNLGMLAMSEGRTEEARGYFEEAVRRNPQYTVALQNLGNLYVQQGDFKAAHQILEKAYRLDPQDPEVNYSLGMAFAQQNDSGQAVKYLQRAIELRPGYAAALTNLGVVYRRAGKRDEAVTALEKCIRVAPDFDHSYLNLAGLYLAEGKREKAEEVLKQLLTRHPDHALARKALEQLER